MPTREAIEETRERIWPFIHATPTLAWRSAELDERLGHADTTVDVKLELLQFSGTFKYRAAVHALLDADPDRGLTTVSAGNHAIAVARAAKEFGLDAQIAMLKSANPMRVALCRSLGARVTMVDDGHSGFEWCQQQVRDEGRLLIHPFEGMHVSLATATIGLEMTEQVTDLDAVVVPIGGGGLASGVAAAVKLCRPECRVYGVEPVGAPTMTRSFAAGGPTSIEQVDTIADSLGAPFAGELTYSLCREHLDDIVLVDDDQLRDAQALLFRDWKLAVEPACAASTAALLGPLRERLAGKRVGLIACGSNIDPDTFADQVRDVVAPASQR